MKVLVVLTIVILTTYALSVSSDVQEKWKNFKKMPASSITNIILPENKSSIYVPWLNHTNKVDELGMSLKNRFDIKHQRQFKSFDEEAKRFKIFTENLEQIENHNKLYEQGLSSYKKGINQFTDMSHDEFMKNLNTKPKPKLSKQRKGKFITLKNGQTLNAEEYAEKIQNYKKIVLKDDVPDAFDWREQNAVGPIKDQGLCSSWAFAAVGVLETYFYVRTGELRQFSEQQLIDCDTRNNGCDYGDPINSYDYMWQNGLSTSEEYPFVGEAGTCNENTTNNADELNIRGYMETLDYGPFEEDIKWDVVNDGALTALINGNFLPTYEGGILDDIECTADVLNHDVLIVGYGIDENNVEYWTIKNSWGTEWGEDGYARIARNHNNTCGIVSRMTTLL